MKLCHWFHYRDDNVYFSPMSYLRDDSEKPLEGPEVFGMKPMNCPNAMNIFKLKTRSYNDCHFVWLKQVCCIDLSSQGH